MNVIWNHSGKQSLNFNKMLEFCVCVFTVLMKKTRINLPPNRANFPLRIHASVFSSLVNIQMSFFPSLSQMQCIQYKRPGGVPQFKLLFTFLVRVPP